MLASLGVGGTGVGGTRHFFAGILFVYLQIIIGGEEEDRRNSKGKRKNRERERGVG